MLIVQKYGGTSVGNPERIKNVARRVCRTKEEGHDVIVVVSAMSGETDKLINLASQVAENPDPREMDMLVSTGERVTIALLAMAIHSLGHKAQSFTGRQAGIISDSVHTKARIEKITGERIRQAIKDGKIAVVAGFQGINDQSDVTTLGRGGSDLTAVAVAAALK
ncbi:MAG TPA: aspartate kinase, partial [Nitrospirota bacterium]|nr:aspartate kinase [Nitrospirota bacterium]